MKLRTYKKAMGWCTAKMLLFCAKTILKESHKFELARLKEKKKKEKHFLAVWQLSILVHLRCFLAPLDVLLLMKTLQDEW